MGTHQSKLLLVRHRPARTDVEPRTCIATVRCDTTAAPRRRRTPARRWIQRAQPPCIDGGTVIPGHFPPLCSCGVVARRQVHAASGAAGVRTSSRQTHSTVHHRLGFVVKCPVLRLLSRTCFCCTALSHEECPGAAATPARPVALFRIRHGGTCRGGCSTRIHARTTICLVAMVTSPTRGMMLWYILVVVVFQAVPLIGGCCCCVG